jgi:DNA-binding response OmpR family regulator
MPPAVAASGTWPGEFRANMVQRIVAFEPSPEYRSVIDGLLDEEGGFLVQIAETYEGFLGLLDHSRPDLVLVSFPDLPEAEPTLAALRQSIDSPILAFVLGPEETKAALRGGADYDLPKPFDPEVFTIAVDAVLRRAAMHYSTPSLLPSAAPIGVHDLKVFPDRRTVERDGRRQALSQTEWQLFAFLLRQPGRVFTRRELAAGAWGPGYASRNGQAELYISRVRRKVERDPQRPRIIETVRGSGYRLVPDPELRRLTDESSEDVG